MFLLKLLEVIEFMKNKKELIENLTLLLLYLNSWEEKDKNIPEHCIHCAWKNYDFDTLDILNDKDLINTKHKSKIIYLTQEGIEQAERILKGITENNK
jgi:hypothetical protein